MVHSVICSDSARSSPLCSGHSTLVGTQTTFFALGHNLLTWQLLSMHQQMLKTPYLLDKSAFRLHSLLSPG